MRFSDGRFSHSADDRFDRAFSYDNAARVSEAYSGSEARDFINGGNSGTPTGPYRQSYQYSGFDQITQQTSRLWSQTQTANNTFVNNRLQGWSYDADGGLINDGSTSYGRDAAGLLVQNGNSASYFVNKYDGDGQLTRTSIQYQNGSETFIHYYLNSSVLGLAVSKLTSNGTRQESYVYAGGKKIATASPWQALWVHEDPVTGSHGISIVGGLYGADAEFNADGFDVGFAEPTEPAPDAPDFKYPEVAGGAGCSVGNPNCVACYMDHVEHDCREVSGLLSQEFVKPCPDNDCGPKWNPTVNNGRGSYGAWEYFHVFANYSGWMTSYGLSHYQGGRSFYRSEYEDWMEFKSHLTRTSLNFSAFTVFLQSPQNPLPGPKPQPAPTPPGLPHHKDIEQPCIDRANDVRRDIRGIAQMLHGTARAFPISQRFPGTTINPRGQSFGTAVNSLQQNGFTLDTVFGFQPLDHPEGENYQKQFSDGLWYHVIVNYPGGASGALIRPDVDPRLRTPRITVHCHATDPSGSDHLWDTVSP